MLKKIKIELYLWKKWARSIVMYPRLRIHNATYDEYWDYRHLTAETPLNSFQAQRLALALRFLEPKTVVTDIGAGNGLMLVHIGQKKELSRRIAVDISDRALASARANGIEVVKANISDTAELQKLPDTDYIFFFEVLEHIPNSEEVLLWATTKAKKGVFFSVPNTGFFTYRLRLLFGKFPLQWRLSPSEHLRFWTMTDMRWWLKSIGMRGYTLLSYEGPVGLRHIWPSLFAQGLFVYIPTLGAQMPREQADNEDKEI